MIMCLMVSECPGNSRARPVYQPAEHWPVNRLIYFIWPNKIVFSSLFLKSENIRRADEFLIRHTFTQNLSFPQDKRVFS